MIPVLRHAALPVLVWTLRGTALAAFVEKAEVVFAAPNLALPTQTRPKPSCKTLLLRFTLRPTMPQSV